MMQLATPNKVAKGVARFEAMTIKPARTSDNWPRQTIRVHARRAIGFRGRRRLSISGSTRDDITEASRQLVSNNVRSRIEIRLCYQTGVKKFRHGVG